MVDPHLVGMLLGDSLTDADRTRIEAELENAVYAAALNFYEPLENKSHIRGNGHHMAHKLCAYARALLRERWTKNMIEQIGALDPGALDDAIDAYARTVRDKPMEEHVARQKLHIAIEESAKSNRG